MLVMTLLGPDRPGLVESVASLVAEAGGNWLESRMSRLGGQFAGILRVEVPPGNQEKLSASLEQLGSRGLKVMVHPDEPAAAPAPAALRTLDIIGHDQPGIVRQLSKVLARHQVNVEELHSECASAAMSGETLFKAHAKLRIPQSCSVAELQQELERIAADLIVDIAIREPKP